MTLGPRVREVVAVPPRYVRVATVDRSFQTMRGSSRVPLARDSITRVRTAGPAAVAAGASPTGHDTAGAVPPAAPEPARGDASAKRTPSARARMSEARGRGVGPEVLPE